jgi:hypothetical protein
MARLVLSVGGMVLGNLILPGLGSAIGGVLGSYVGGIVDQQLFGDSPQETVYGPRLQDLRVHSSSYGAVIPLVFGKARLGGNVIWMRGFREEVRTSTTTVGGSGKGGDSSTGTTVENVSYHYYADVGVGLCRGPIQDVTRIWADGNRWQDENAADVRIHKGGASQSPDPLIQAVEGADRTPAYRGLAYVVFADLYLTPFGNRLPQFTFEIEA